MKPCKWWRYIKMPRHEFAVMTLPEYNLLSQYARRYAPEKRVIRKTQDDGTIRVWVRKRIWF